MLRDGTWLNEPARWSLSAGGELEVVTDRGTDFWQETHYGFRRDSGHFYAVRTPSAFTAQLRVRAEYRDLYDQAGLMVRSSETVWVKAGIERSDGRATPSSVVTLGRSDWATGSFDGDPADLWIRATVGAGVLRLQISSDGTFWPLLRLAPFPEAESYLVGPMACTPERSGLQVRFSEFELGPPLGRDLHDLT